MAELTAAPIGNLLRRLFREHEREGKVFDLPARKFWHGSPELDTSVLFHGRRAANPLGPAAGPQSQMAQNLVLAWLAGSRIIELKTVQVNDQLTIPRPCIDATNVVYNVEWSQELKLAASLREYVTGSMLLDILREVNLLGRPSDVGKDETLLDMSVGYDLEGIRSPAVRSWIEAVKDARIQVEALRREIPGDFKHLRDLDFRTELSSQITLSTFHGCPAGEIESIVRFLLTEMDVDVTVKLNPTLLGRREVDALLHDLLGYTEVETRQEDFDKDLQWEQALEIADRLTELARSLGRTFQVKLTNTLVVKNHRDFFPATEKTQYLSGQPLHVITLSLLEKLRKARPHIPISFSAGVDNRNFPDCVALGLTPVTTCSDLLRPGGYGRLPRYLQNLEERMRALGVRSIGDFVVKACGRGTEAVRVVIEDTQLRTGLLEALNAESTDLEAALSASGQAHLGARLVEQAALLNTPAIAEKVRNDPRYRAEKNSSVPRKIGSRLALFDCINCDKCLPVCPNDANFAYETETLRSEYQSYAVRGGEAVPAPGGVFEVKARHQIANFQDFCNDCGNCDTFCPEDGGPHVEKPRFFGALDVWKQLGDRDGFFVLRQDDVDAIWGRVRGKEYHLEIDRLRDRGLFTDGIVTLELRHSERRLVRANAKTGAPEGHVLDFAAYLSMAVAVDGVLDPRTSNPVNAPYL